MRPLVTESFPLTGHRIIEASAGTGKTHTITNLYLRLLLGDDDEQRGPLTVDNILVLTFTVAATEELRRRIRNRIQEARLAISTGESPDPFLDRLASDHQNNTDAHRLLTAALQLMDEASIFTIHGFCARVLGEHAFETGVLFNQNLDADRETLLHQAVEDCFRTEILTLPDVDRALALTLWPDPARLEQAIKGMLFRPNLELKPPYSDPAPVKERLNKHIARVKDLWLRDNVADILSNAGIHAGRPTIKRLEEFTTFCQSDNHSFELWEYWTTNYIRKNLNKDGAMPDHPVLDLIDSIHEDRQTLKQTLTANLWNRVIQVTRERMNRFKAEYGQLTLDDLLTQVSAALTRPETGKFLAERLVRRWPVAMVDEFQDTDDLQYEIFSRMYRRPGNHSLLFIGDPKQAIYQFRGADVYTYINAKRQVRPEEDLYSLDTNWRSSRTLIDATNRLFNQPNIFLNDKDIPFIQVSPSPIANDRSLRLTEEDATPITLWYFHANDKLNKDDARDLAMDCAAEETSRLLNMGVQGEALVDGHPLVAGQIAFLVRDRHDAGAARVALRRRGIRSVYVTQDSVFLSDTAGDLKLVLEAVIDPANDRTLRAALASTLMQCTADEIDNLNHNVIHQQQVLSEFFMYHRLWANQGIAPMIESLIHTRGLGEKWLGRPEGERQLTNLRHLAELLQTRSIATHGMHRLLKWFEHEQANAENVSIEERQLRLESDENLVKIVTMHAAKGLEYDVVMIPMAGFRSEQRKNEPALFHEFLEHGFNALVDLYPSEESRTHAQDEKLAEDMRLLYVAITRAKYKCYIGLPHTSDISNTALARLLNLPDSKAGSGVIHKHLTESFQEPLFTTKAITSRSDVTPFTPAGDHRKLIEPGNQPRIHDQWRLHSYTSLTSLISDEETGITPIPRLPGFGDDDNTSREYRDHKLSRYTFPRGPGVGIALHDLLERVDFQQSDEALVTACKRTLNHLGGYDDAWLDILYQWVTDILQTPLMEDGNFSLADITRQHRLTELEFHFPLNTTNDLVQLVKRFGYMSESNELPTSNLTGMMTGLIDLVIRRDDQFYVVDYKSNYLGNEWADYETEYLHDAVQHHRYDLQYLIYSVALNRYLASRIATYDYDRHFGGVMYLFLRGMEGPDYPGRGVFYDRPDSRLIAELDQLLEGST
ncbi:MAG: exodeoxyribonuclease V subunit beta [Pseudomonadales bacterium]